MSKKKASKMRFCDTALNSYRIITEQEPQTFRLRLLFFRSRCKLILTFLDMVQALIQNRDDMVIRQCIKDRLAVSAVLHQIHLLQYT